MPLDRRTIDWLYSADTERKYARKSRAAMADLVIRDLDRIQSDIDRDKEKRFNDQMAEANDRALFEFRRLEKKGITGKASFWR